jgi:hypothetical protein
MKKQGVVKTAVILLAAILVLGLTGCNDEPKVPAGDPNDATLRGIKVAGTTGVVATPISEQQWDSPNFPLTTDGYTGNLTFTSSDGLSSNPVIALTLKNKKAKAEYAVIGTSGTRPQSFIPTVAALQNSQYLYVKITSQNENTINYYRFLITVSALEVRIGPTTTNSTMVPIGQPFDKLATATKATTGFGRASIASGHARNAQIHIKAPTDSTVEYAVVFGSGAPTFVASGGGSAYNFIDDNNAPAFDTLYLKLTLNGVDSYFKVAVTVFFDASLATLRFTRASPNTIFNVSADDFGSPAATWNGDREEEGGFAPGIKPPAAGLAILATPRVTGADVSWATVVGGTTAPTTYNKTTPITTFSGTNDYLYIKVVAVDNVTTLIYKIKVDFLAVGKIFYGTPKLTDPANSANTSYIDPIWNTEQWDYMVNRVNTAESSRAWFKTDYGRHTSGKVKALWDDDGIWVYADVTFKDYKESADGPTLTRTISLDTSGSTSDNHLKDSLEIFINERLAHMELPINDGQNDWGNQFRVSGNNVISGNMSAYGTPNPSPLTNFQRSGRSRAWEKTGAEKGYIVIAQLPFAFSPLGGADQTAKDQSDIWNPNGTIKDGVAKIGFELQINACSDVGARDGILTWNGVYTQAYINARGFGEVTLEMGTGRQRPVMAERPIIPAAGQPQNTNFELNAAVTTPLSVTVTAPTSPTASLSYQWWSTNTLGGEGAAIGGATLATYSPPTTALGRNWYWVIVKNTDTAASADYREMTTTSTRARVIIYPVGGPVPADFTVDLAADSIINDEAWTGTYGPGYVITLNGDTGLSMSEYGSFTVTFRGWNANEQGEKTTQITTIGASSVQLKYFSYVATTANDDNEIDVQYNVGQSGQLQSGVRKDLPASVLGVPTLKSLGFQNGGNSNVPFFEVQSIVFHQL